MGRHKIFRVLLGDDPAHFSDARVFDYLSASSLVEENVTPGTVVIDGLDNKDEESRSNVFEALSILRRSAVFCCAPVYFSRTMGDIDQLSDGVTGDINERLPEAEAILDRTKYIHLDKLVDNYSLRLLSYMYTRGEAYELKPLCVPFSPWVYVYPAAAVILDDTASRTRLKGEDIYRSCGVFKFDAKMPHSTRIVNSLAENGYVEGTSIVDRIRRCPKCGTGHLNYVDICPNCGEIDFEKKAMLHCFTCGHVAPEDDFMRSMSFICPNCGTALRHLGSDYDRPLESYECNGCGFRFIEPDVKAACFYCGTQTPPDDLIVNNVFVFHISDKGAAAARAGTMQTAIRLFDEMNNVVFQYFCRTVEWLVNLRKRYPDEIFSLIGVKFFGFYEAEEVLGEGAFNALKEAMVSRIKEIIRSTDMITSTAPDTFWILLPRTDAEKCCIVAARLSELSKLVELPSMPQVKIVAKCFVLPENLSGTSVEKQIEIFTGELL